MAKKGKFDRSCYIPNQGKYSKSFWDDGWKAEQEGMTEEFKNRKKQLKNRKKQLKRNKK